MTKVPASCKKFLEGPITAADCEKMTEEFVECVARKMSDNDGKTRIGAGYRREAHELLTKVCQGEIQELNPETVGKGTKKMEPWMTPEMMQQVEETMAILNQSPLFGKPDEEEELSADDFMDLVEGDEDD